MAQSTNSQAHPLKVATFGGGCFWCMEPGFDALEGVEDTVVGYTGGMVKNPSYQQISTGTTGHVEAIQVTYDPIKVSYEKLLEVYWENIDPTDPNGQFADKGTQYKTVIFFHDEAQRVAAEVSMAALGASKKFDKPIVTTIEPAAPFYVAEDYHQNYYKKNAAHYNTYKRLSGRGPWLKKTWGAGK